MTKNSNWRRLLLIHLLPLIAFLLIGASVATIAGQDQNWDLHNYHYYIPYAFIHHRESRDFAVSGIQSFANPLLDTVSYSLIQNFRPIVASAILGAIQSLNVWIIYELAILIFSRFIKNKWLYVFAFIISVLSFFGAGNLGEVGETMTDNLDSIPILLSLLMVLMIIKNRYRCSHKKILTLKFIAYGVLGIAVGLKLTDIIFAVPLVFLEIFNYKSMWNFVRQGLWDGFSFLIGMFLSIGPWSIYLYRTYKSPFFPIYNAIFHSPYYSNSNFNSPQWFPHGLMHILFFPFYFLFHPSLTAETHFTDPRIALLLIVMIVFLVFLVIRYFTHYFHRIKIPKEVLALLSFVIIGYVLWEKFFAYYRYLMVLEFLSITTIAVVIWIMIPKRKVALVVLATLMVLVTVITRPMDWTRIPWQKSFFGVQIPPNFVKRDSAVLLAGSVPIGYLIPFFPPSIYAIRVEDPLQPTLESSPASQRLIRSKIETLEKDGSNFYGVETPGATIDVESFKQYGFENSTCKTITSNQGGGYSICKLVKIS